MYNNYYPQPNQQYAFSIPKPQARYTQPLTNEQIAKLRNNSKAFDMKVEPDDLLRAACTHREKNGNPTLIQNNDGSYTCTICHETFRMPEVGQEEVQASVDTVINMLQTIKSVYLDAPDRLIVEFFQLIPLLKKIPQLWAASVKNFAMYDGQDNSGINQIAPGYNGFTAIGTLLTNPYAGNGGYPQVPGFQQQYQNPMMPQPYYNANPYGQPMNMGQQPMMDPNAVNPMAYGTPAAPVNGAPYTAPVAPAPGVMPSAPVAAPVAPAPAPAATPATTQTAEVQQQTVFNV